MIIDAHHHLWKLDRGVYDWISDDISAIRRDFLPTDLAPLLARADVQKTVLVQASETVTENAFLIEQSNACDNIGAIAAWVDLTAPEIEETLAALAQIEIVKGIRPVLQGIEDTEWVLRPDVLRALSCASDLGLRFDALITPRHLLAIDELARLIPALPIVIDHAAKPLLGPNTPLAQDWRAGMSRLAQHPQIHAKFSGLSTEFGAGWTKAALEPVFDAMFADFGAERLMWGSDWPVLNLEADYQSWVTCVRALVAPLSPKDQVDILGGTAANFYGISA